MNEIATIAADLEILQLSYSRRWFANGPGHSDNARLFRLESAAAEAHAALNHFLRVLGK